MTNLEKLKEIIQKANPEIMELKFGCEVEVRMSDDPYYKNGIYKAVVGRIEPDSLIVMFVDKENKRLLKLKKTKSNYWATKKQIIKSLGRPIRLADVLIAMNKAKIDSAIQDYGCFMLDREDEIGDSIEWQEITSNGERRHWNLQKDNLDDQPKETIDFLYNLLTKD